MLYVLLLFPFLPPAFPFFIPPSFPFPLFLLLPDSPQAPTILRGLAVESFHFWHSAVSPEI